MFGFGWLLLAWALAAVVLFVWLIRRQGWNADTRSYLPIVLLTGAAIALLLPRLEERNDVGLALGLPIRGFGMMLLLAVSSGVALAVRQARRMGLDPDVILSLAFHVFIGGIVGARTFYVVQYWPQFRRETWLETIAAVANMMQGGLVVYGSLIGAGVVAIWFFRKRHLPVLAMADLVAPSLALGLAIGRIGCFLNGCCHGGLCDGGLTFPMESPPYAHQREHGQLHGFSLASIQRFTLPGASGRAAVGEGVVVSHVIAGSAAERGGLQVGDVIRAIDGYRVESPAMAREILKLAGPNLRIETQRGTLLVAMERFPDRSRPVHPTQLYSSLNAALICLLLWSFYPFRRRDGEVFALGLGLKSITRFLLEIIRDDEPGRFGTSLTISQILSLLLLAGAVALWFYIRRQPRGSRLPPPASRGAAAAG